MQGEVNIIVFPGNAVHNDIMRPVWKSEQGGECRFVQMPCV